ncbi:MAG TPA: FG-GAP-like repeat-containing protein [Longimicrobium sp.]
MIPLLALLPLAGCDEKQPTATSAMPSTVEAGALGAGLSFAKDELSASLHASAGMRSTESMAEAGPPNAAGPTHIVLQNVTTGLRVGWDMNQSTFTQSIDITTQPTEWQIVASADFTGDGMADLVWQRRSTGEQVIWHMDGFRWTGAQTQLQRVDPLWWIVGAADFTGDGKPDLVWQNRNEGRQVIWHMNGTQWGGGQNELTPVTPEWWIVATGDFSGDGKPDLVWQNRNAGRQVIWQMNGTAWNGGQNELTQVTPDWHIVGAGDFNSDGKPDLLWQRPNTGSQVIWFMSGTQWSGQQTPLMDVPSSWRIATAFARPTATTSLNLNIGAVYGVQSVQTVNRAVPLVAGKAAYLRIFATASQANSARPTVEVRLAPPGAAAATYTIQPSVSAPGVPTGVAEGNLDGSWNLLVPAALVVPGTSVTVTVDPGNTVPESNEADNSATFTLDVRTVSALNATLIPIRHSNGVTGNVIGDNAWTFMRRVESMYPINAINLVLRAPLTTTAPVFTGSNTSYLVQVLNEVDAARIADGAAGLYYGVFNRTSGSYGGSGGVAYRGGSAGIGHDDLNHSQMNYRADYILAHEMGHNWGRQHVDCGGPLSPDPNYPNAGGTISAWGRDMSTGILKPPSDRDVMSYCNPVWVSPYTYNAILQYRAARPSSGPPAGGELTAVNGKVRLATQPAGTRVPTLLVSGSSSPKRLVLDPAFSIETVPVLPDAAGRFTLEGVGADGEVIFRLRFAGSVVDDGDPAERHFVFAVPVSEAEQARLVTLRLTDGGRQTTLRAGGAGRPSADPVLRGTRAGVGMRNARLSWDARSYPKVLVRDPATGLTLGFAREGDATFQTDAREVEVLLSNGVRSQRRRVALP